MAEVQDPNSTTAEAPVFNLRVLFLDIDGVICCNKDGVLEADKLEQLIRVVKETGCKICLSTNWRLYDDLREYLYEHLAALGMECIGTTPDAGENTHGEPMRPCEIGAWMKFWNQGKTRPKIQNFVAVDDRPLIQENGGSFLRGHFVQTSLMSGLTEGVAMRLIELLQDKSPADGDKGRSSPDSVILPLSAPAAAPTTPPCRAKGASGRADHVASSTSNDYQLRSVIRVKHSAATMPPPTPLTTPAARPQPFLPIGGSRTTMSRELASKPVPGRSLVPVADYESRVVAFGRRSGVEAQSSAAWAAPPLQSSTLRLTASRPAPQR